MASKPPFTVCLVVLELGPCTPHFSAHWLTVRLLIRRGYQRKTERLKGEKGQTPSCVFPVFQCQLYLLELITLVNSLQWIMAIYFTGNNWLQIGVFLTPTQSDSQCPLIDVTHRARRPPQRSVSCPLSHLQTATSPKLKLPMATLFPLFSQPFE